MEHISTKLWFKTYNEVRDLCLDKINPEIIDLTNVKKWLREGSIFRQGRGDQILDQVWTPIVNDLRHIINEINRR